MIGKFATKIVFLTAFKVTTALKDTNFTVTPGWNN